MKMEPNKTEQEFKSKLEGRTIQPSAQAWDRLDAMLTVAEEKKPRKKRAWLYIAASFIAFITVGAFLLQQEKNTNGNTIITNDPVVTTTVETEVQQQPVAKEALTIGVESTVTNSPIVQQKAIATVTQPPSKKEKSSDYHTIQNEANNKEEFKPSSTGYEEIAVAVTPTTEKVITKKMKQGITIDPDALLASVEQPETKSITASKNNKSKIKVNSNTLLSSVEGELNESFRTRVLKSAVKNYNAVKTSVANRNYQQNH
ncbi:hypothetical protein E0W68_10335 [Flavobacterium salilacus subsp. salilacus]|uniref:hypothetical protein n=1 Tax=Flavobacterium TaxID=237 RepID=UPI001074D2AC|nr:MULTISPECIES: hypothetical protein [Flavobacterium]KAF2518127.1 hypothetical protein E0W68_10335 [Flavobacterium salilacus subsp. salilacus]MBE1615563.1 hypothetical protein [Flavobacterium sp. SaA2.13]